LRRLTYAALRALSSLQYFLRERLTDAGWLAFVAAGTAAALALSGNTIPRDIAVEKLQQTLRQQGAFIGRDQAVPEGL